MASEVAKRDDNFVPVLMLEKDDGSGEVMMARADTSGRLKVTMTGGGTGDVVGPGSSTDNAAVRWNGTTGVDVQNSVVIIGDTGAVTGITTAVASTSITIGAAGTATGNLLIKGTTSGTITIKSADAAGTYSLTLPTSDGNASEFLQTDGSGVLSWAVPTAAAAGLDTQVQFNDGGSALGGDAGFVYNKTTNTATLDVIQLTNSGLKVLDTNASHYLIITPGSDISANRVFTITTGDAARTLSMAGNITTAADFITVGANSLTLTTSAATDVTLPTTGTLATLAGTEELDNKTLDASVAKGTWTASGTWTIPAVTLGGTISWGTQAASGTLTNGGTITTIDINGGTVDGTVIGGASAAAITGTVITANTSVIPDANDGAVLGAADNSFSDLYLASGALIGFANGNAVITHSSGVLTVSTGDLRVTTAGTDAASAVTVGGTQTLTNKTLTSPTLTTPSAFTTGGVITLAENTSIAYDPAGSADGKYTGLTIAGTAGEALAFGDVIVLDVTAGKWFKGSVSAAAGADGDLRGGTGMCVLAAAGDASATTVLLHGTCRADANFPALTIGSVVYASTSGDITVTQPTTTDHIIKVLGFALTADEILFNPSMDYITHT